MPVIDRLERLIRRGQDAGEFGRVRHRGATLRPERAIGRITTYLNGEDCTDEPG